jgi:peptidoglycan/LPS O-acetylase OafA/YrhL
MATPGRLKPAVRDGFRPDIQGLRGVAVLIVALGHADVPFLGGGYVGVDVFFVISGFLITRWLLGRALEPARVPFASFYAARARRILPAASLTLVATCAASAVYLNPVRALSAIHDAVWAAFFAANLHFADVGANYFARDNPPSPIQHFWTLAVEEQFYLVWPLLLAAALLVLRLARPGRSVSRGGLAVLVGVAVAASLGWSIHQTATDPTAAYFSTAARGWELGVGVLIAIAIPWIPRCGARLRAALSWLGLAGIAVAAVAFGNGTPFPGYAALLPVLSAGLVVASGVTDGVDRGAAAVLARQPLVLVGDVSYAFYLWHWPALVIPAQYEGHKLSTPVNLALLAAAFALSCLTYRVYENPLRHARALRRPRRALILWPVTVSAVLAATALGASSLTVLRPATPSLGIGRVPNHIPGTRTEPRPVPLAKRLHTALIASVTPARLRQPVPDALSPSVGQLMHDRYDLGDCTAQTATGWTVCHLGDVHARRRLVVIGDSHAEMWMPGFVRFATHRHWQLIPLIKDGCVPSVMQRDCSAWYSWMLAEVRRLHPQAIVLSQFWSSWGGSGVAAVTRELDELAPLTRRLVVMQDAPIHGRPSVDCLLAHGATLGSCTFGVTASETEAYAAVRGAAQAVHARYVGTLQWLCSSDRCPTVIGTIVTYRDRTHLTATYAQLLAGPLDRVLARRMR